MKYTISRNALKHHENENKQGSVVIWNAGAGRERKY
jgi:hypothetical protein